ncbi:S8 family serine peptidase [Geothrix sp. 21YS21S-2]|uniref:S8 family serine peptidase n=1 Tax=Geothrix sp. 21YS21S-2 TaxID=3068893 RepID=UPI0027B97692|nr:S8 family serine peptidase [Geothrix sp. 21YS21S-2]
MPNVKLIIPNPPGTPLAHLRHLAGTAVSDQRSLGAHFTLADLGIPLGGPGDAWDVAHEAALQMQRRFLEPDVSAGFPEPSDPAGTREALAEEDGRAHDQVEGPLKGPGFGWHRLPDYAQLEAARLDANAGHPSETRVAICDVGFDLEHEAFPRDRVQYARNFLPDAAPANVRDRDVHGLLKNPGHGTGTMGILAAGKLGPDIVSAEPAGLEFFLGAAPDAFVVPLRIATSVVLFSVSSFVEAMEYLLDLDARGIHTDVVSMSMGGVGSAAWADVVNRAYARGILVVTAAGNNVPLGLGLHSPTSTVFPARFNRVVSATGVTAGFAPYATITDLKMRGNYGPPSKMRTAIAAYTPNSPWAFYRNDRRIDLDGQGTSSATPQVAGAAALYLRKHKGAMAGWEPWQVAEATRRALFRSARRTHPVTGAPLLDCDTYFGAGLLAALDALQCAPEQPGAPEPEDSVFLPALDVLFGNAGQPLAGWEGEDAFRKMLWLETVQLIHRDPQVEAAVADPDSGSMSGEEQANLRKAILDSPEASATLKRFIDAGYRSPLRTLPRRPIDPPPPVREEDPPPPQARRLQAYAFDPSLSGRFESFGFNKVSLDVPWEKLDPGPCGEYLAVIDHDPATGCFYPPVNLDHPHLLASEGLPQSPGNPQFHQQMVYAVAMRTIRNFEMALGRRVQWSPRMRPGSPDDSAFVQRLHVHPHALREQNAYYHPGKKALLFGYFPAEPADPQELYTGGITFSCLSQDIIAHETTHAILDGIYRRFNNPTNPDQLAFHEGFADLVALLQHFTIASVVESQVRRVRGDLKVGNALMEMAREFGEATGMHGALRTAIGGGADPATGRPDYLALGNTTEIHDRGAILVAAVFDAFLKIYDAKTADLRRIATGGTGLLPGGEISADLVRRFAGEATALASQFLQMCIRALDYCPPVDLTFADYLRALITADHDLLPSDPWGYRIAIAESFRQRAIFPANVITFGEETLLWHRPKGNCVSRMFQSAGQQLELLATHLLHLDPGPAQEGVPRPGARRRMFKLARGARATLHNRMRDHILALPAAEREEISRELGLDLGGEAPVFEVHTATIAERQGPDGRMLRQFVLTFLQGRTSVEDGVEIELWSGATVLLDRHDRSVRYIITKSAHSPERAARNRAFALAEAARNNPYFATSADQRFALIHAAGRIRHD